jgi:hypothetical protein
VVDLPEAVVFLVEVEVQELLIQVELGVQELQELLEILDNLPVL